MAETQHPFLVYGTLRPGGGNYKTFLQGHTFNEETLRVRGFNMYGSRRDGFPYVTAGDTVITATLISVKPDHYEHVKTMLDYLEGYGGVPGHPRNHYERKLVTIRNSAGERVKAWVYVIEGSEAEYVAGHYQRTFMGDWILQNELAFA